MNEELFGLLGGDPDKIREQARMAGLLNFAASMLQASGPSRMPQSVGANIGAALPAYGQGFQGEIDSTLKNLAMNQKLQEEKRRQDAMKAFQSRIAAATTMQPTTTGAGAQQSQALANQMLFPGETTISPQDLSLTQGALMSNVNLPMSAVTDQAAANQAVMDYLRQTDPVEYAKLISKETKDAPGTVGQYMAAMREGLIPQGTTLKEFNDMIKAPGTTVNVGGEASPFGKEAQKLQAQNFADLSKAGGGARRNLSDINRLEGLLDKSPSGLVAGAKVFAGNFGIPTEGLDNLQAAQAIINRLVPQQRPPGSGTMSDADLALFKQSLPRIINQPGGNKIIIQTMRQINEYLIKEGEIANQALNGKITPEEASRRISELANPLENFADRIGGSVSSGNFPSLKTDDVNLINKYLKR
jgi:hypothetical protein